MIYVLRVVFPVPNMFVFKIGHFDRSDVRGRTQEIAKNNAPPVIDWLVFEGDVEDEKTLLHAFRRYRRKGEYFDFTSVAKKCKDEDSFKELFKEMLDIVLPNRIVETAFLREHIRQFLYENFHCYAGEPDSPQDKPSLKDVYEYYLAFCIQHGYMACSKTEFKRELLSRGKIGYKTFNAQTRLNMRLRDGSRIKRL